MTLEQDKIARVYLHRRIKDIWPSFLKPLLLICLPVSLVASWALFTYDTERPHAWFVALISTPLMFVVLQTVPFIVLLLRSRWVINDDSVLLRGPVHGRIDGSKLTRWTVLPEDRLPGYFNLSIATKDTGYAILLCQQTYPMAYVESQMKKRFGEQAAT
jgi:hypothetical protein